MSPSRRTRRQQKFLHRHQLRLEGLEKRYALSAGWLSRTELINTAENFPITQAVVLDINQDSWTDLIVAQTDFSGPSTPDPDGPPGSTVTNGQPGWISIFENRQGTLVYVGSEQATTVNPLASSRGLIESSGADDLGSGIGLGSTGPELALASGEIWSFGTGVGGTAFSFQKTSGASNSLVEGDFHRVMDLDGDSHNEWLSTIGGGAQPLLMSVQRNQGNGSFSSSTSTNFGVNCLGSYLVDFDSDGLVDALAVRKTEDATAGQWAEVKLEFWKGVSNGTQFSYVRDLLAPKPQSMFPTEMNGDGYIDVVSFINGGQDIEIYLGTPDHALGEPTVLSTGNSADHYTGAYLSWVGGPDLNNDGLYDVLFADGRYIQKFIFGDAHGNFQVRDPHGDGWGNQPFHGIAGADFDKDGLFEAISITNQSDLRSGENRNWISEFGYFGSELDATPSTPRDLQVVAGVSEASLSWDAPISGGSSTVTGYVLSYRVSNGNWVTVDAGSSPTYTVIGLPSALHEFRVAAVNSVGQSPWSTTVTATPQALVTAPSAPINFQVQTPSGGGAVIYWDAPLSDGGIPVESYVLSYRASGGQWSNRALSATSPNMAYTQLGLPTGVLHEFRVAAVNSVGQSPWSTTVTATPQALVTAPSAPINFQVQTPSGGGAVIYWDAPLSDGGIPVESYVLSYRASGGQWSNRALSATSPNMAYTQLGLPTGVLHEFRVAAVNSVGQSPWSTTVTATPQALVTAPSAPINFQVQTPSGGGAVIYWDAPLSDGGIPVESYVLSYRASGGQWSNRALSATSPNMAYTQLGLPTGVLHEFRVAAVNSVGQSPWSTTVTATPQALVTAPSAPINFQVQTPSGGGAVIYWDAPLSDGGIPVESYVLSYRASGGQWSNRALSATSPNMAYTQLGLPTGVLHEFRVAAVNSVGQSPWSTTVTATPQALVTAPSAPINFQVQTPSGGGAVIYWDAPLSDGGIPVESYVLSYRASGGQWSNRALSATSPNMAYTQLGLPTGVLHEFRVAAVNSVGQSPWSTTVTATPQATTL